MNATRGAAGRAGLVVLVAVAVVVASACRPDGSAPESGVDAPPLPSGDEILQAIDWVIQDPEDDASLACPSQQHPPDQLPGHFGCTLIGTDALLPGHHGKVTARYFYPPVDLTLGPPGSPLPDSWMRWPDAGGLGQGTRDIATTCEQWHDLSASVPAAVQSVGCVWEEPPGEVGMMMAATTDELLLVVSTEPWAERSVCGGANPAGVCEWRTEQLRTITAQLTRRLLALVA